MPHNGSFPTGSMWARVALMELPTYAGCVLTPAGSTRVPLGLCTDVNEAIHDHLMQFSGIMARRCQKRVTV